MIFIQNGPAWRPKVKEILEKNLAKGIVWDPREECVERVKDVKSEIPSLTNIVNIVDLKWYYRQFPNAVLRKLEDLSYLPKELIDRSFLRDHVKIEDSVRKGFKYQIQYDVDRLLIPTLYINTFDGRIVDKLLDICDIAINMKKEKEFDMPMYISVVIQENAFNNTSDINDFINDIGNFSGKIDGLYINIDRDNGDLIRSNFNPNRLANIMNFNCTLSNAGFNLIYGYCGLESLLYATSGVKAICTGWFYSLRRFNREDKGLELFIHQGRHIKRYTSISILSEIKMEEYIFQAHPQNKEKICNILLGNGDIDSKIRRSTNFEEISLNDSYIQYFEAMNSMLKPFDDMKNIEERVKYAEEVINNSIKNINEYKLLNPKPIVIPTDMHIRNYKLALEKFKEDHFLS